MKALDENWFMIDSTTAHGATHPTPQGHAANFGAVSQSKGAQFLGVSLSMIKALCRTGELRSFRVGRRRLITMQAIADYMAARETEERDSA